MPKVSVIIPCYNGMPYLQEAVESILRQTLTNFELIIVDDCSTDDSMVYLRSLQDPRIRLLFHEMNKGEAGARNTGIEAAQGEYIAMQDADDISHSERLERQVRLMDANPEIAIASCAAKTFGSQNRYIRVSTSPMIIKSLTPFKYMFCNPAIMYRRSILGEKRYPALRFGADSAFVMSAALQYKASNVRDALYYYRVHSKSVSFTTPNMKEYQRIFFKELIQQRLGFEPTPQEVECHIDFTLGSRAILHNPAIACYLIKSLIKGRHTFSQRCILAAYFIGYLPRSVLRYIIKGLLQYGHKT